MPDVTNSTFEIVERGNGRPLVLIPGIQGRWEYATATVEALAHHFRVITFSLCDERGGLAAVEAAERGPLDVFVEQVDSALHRVGVARAVIVGVSFGGLVALRFAVTRAARTAALVMVSPPGPSWRLGTRHETYAKRPWIFGPLFLAEAPWRLRREVVTALPDRRERLAFAFRQLGIILRAPISLTRMAARARLIGRHDRAADSRLVAVPTLVIQGDPSLDHVTGAGGTAEYERLIAGARLVTIERSGHLGSVTRADECARSIAAFVESVVKGARHSAA
jgi:pimeloyl-ACP methyl ester carboxylesterase